MARWEMRVGPKGGQSDCLQASLFGDIDMLYHSPYSLRWTAYSLSAE